MKTYGIKLLSGASVFISIALSHQAVAATVTNCDEASLRAAIAAGGTVNFACDGVITLSNTLSIAQDTQIDAAGHNVVFNGNNKVRVLHIAARVKLQGLTIANGFTTNAGGGGVFNVGDLTLENCVVVNNRSGYYPGGGIFNQGNLSLNSSTIASNVAFGAGWPFGPFSLQGDVRGVGGGIFAANGSTIISNSAILGNQALGAWSCPTVSGGGFGGGMCIQGGQFTMANSTVAGNRAVGASGGNDCLLGFVGWDGPDSYGGGIHVMNNAAGTLRLVNGTLSGNRVEGGPGGGAMKYGGSGGNGYGGGIFAGSLGVSIESSTIEQNIAVGGAAGHGALRSGYPGGGVGNGIVCMSGVTIRNTILQTSFGSFTSYGHNLIQSTAGISGSVGSDLVSAFLGIGPLQANGGPTLTMSPLHGSLAIDAADTPSSPATDQRGVPRPQGAHADIGAVEVALLQIELTDSGEMRLRYAGVPGESYSLEGTVEFGSGWSAIETKPAGINGAIQYSDLPGTPNRFFRVKSP